MRKLLAVTLVTLFSTAAMAGSPCLGEGMKAVSEKMKTLASEILTIKAELRLVDTVPFFTIAGEMSEQERADQIANLQLVPGDMMWPLDIIIDKEVAKKNGLSEDSIHGFGGFLIVRCKSGTSKEVEKVWHQRDVAADENAAE